MNFKVLIPVGSIYFDQPTRLNEVVEVLKKLGVKDVTLTTTDVPNQHDMSVGDDASDGVIAGTSDEEIAVEVLENYFLFTVVPGNDNPTA